MNAIVFVLGVGSEALTNYNSPSHSALLVISHIKLCLIVVAAPFMASHALPPPPSDRPTTPEPASVRLCLTGRLFHKKQPSGKTSKSSLPKEQFEEKFVGRMICSNQPSKPYQRIVLPGRPLLMRFHKNVNRSSRKDDLEVFPEGQFLWNSLRLSCGRTCPLIAPH